MPFNGPQGKSMNEAYCLSKALFILGLLTEDNGSFIVFL